MRILSLIVFLTSLLSGASVLALQDIPRLTGPVVDKVGLMRRSDRRDLAELLSKYHQSGKAQIQVLIVNSTEPETIEQYSIRVVEEWKLGDQKKDNGVLFLIAVQDRKMRIEVGQGLEGPLPDIYAKRIIADVVTPLFRNQRFSDGVLVGVHEIIRYVDAEFADQNIADSPTRGGSPWPIGFLILIFVVASILKGLGGGRRGFGGGRYYGGGFGGGGGSFGGGGGWSGGGGGFSGGGASGGW